MAMVRAAMVSSARMWSRIAQPTILRVKRSSQIEPPFLGWHVVNGGEPNLIGLPGGEFLVEPVGSDRQVGMAVRSAHPKPPWRSCPNAVMMHEAFDAATARRLPLGAQGRGGPWGAPSA